MLKVEQNLAERRSPPVVWWSTRVFAECPSIFVATNRWSDSGSSDFSLLLCTGPFFAFSVLMVPGVVDFGVPVEVADFCNVWVAVLTSGPVVRGISSGDSLLLLRPVAAELILLFEGQTLELWPSFLQ